MFEVVVGLLKYEFDHYSIRADTSNAQLIEWNLGRSHNSWRTTRARRYDDDLLLACGFCFQVEFDFYWVCGVYGVARRSGDLGEVISHQ